MGVEIGRISSDRRKQIVLSAVAWRNGLGIVNSFIWEGVDILFDLTPPIGDNRKSHGK